MQSEPFAAIQIQMNVPLAMLPGLLTLLGGGKPCGEVAPKQGFHIPELSAGEIPQNPPVFPPEGLDLGLEPGYDVGPDDFRGLTGPNVKITPMGAAARRKPTNV